MTVIAGMDIIRIPTKEEMRDFVDIRTPSHKRNTIKNQLLSNLKVLETEYTKKHEPFDYVCAKVDFLETYDDYMREVVRRSLSKQTPLTPLAEFKFDFKKYADRNRLKLVLTKEVEEDTLQQGMKVRVHTQYEEIWVCDRGHKLSVFIPKDEYEAREGKPKKEKEENKKPKVE